MIMWRSGILLVWLYTAVSQQSPPTLSWTLNADGSPVNKPTTRLGAAMWTIPNGTVSDDIFVYGGILQGLFNVSQEVWHYSISSRVWTLVRANSGSGHADRGFAQVQWTPLGLVIEGGISYDTVANRYLSQQVDVIAWQPTQFSYASGGANFVPHAQPPRLFGHTMSYVNGALYLVGGFISEPAAPYEDFLSTTLTMPVAYNFSFDATYGLSFDHFKTPLFSNGDVFEGIAFHTATVIDTHIWVLGGRSLDGFDTPIVLDSDGLHSNGDYPVSSYDSVNDVWTQYAPTGPLFTGRWGHSANLFGGQIYMFGGWTVVSTIDTKVNELRSLDPVSMRWTVYSPNNAPSARIFHASIVAQYQQGCSALFVFGGTQTPANGVISSQSAELARLVLGNGGAGRIAAADILNDMDMIILPPHVTSLDGCTESLGGVVQCAPSGNDALTIIGASLDSPTLNVTIDGSLCSLSLQTATELICTVPAGQHSTTPVVLLNACSLQLNLTGMMAYRTACSSTTVPPARFGAVMWTNPNTSVVSDTLFVYGGLLTADLSTAQDVWLYNTSSSCWLQERSNTVTIPGGGFTRRAFARGAHTSTGFVLFGGASDRSDPNNILVNQIDVVTWHPLLFDLTRANVQSTGPNPPNAVYGHTMNYFNGSLFIFGGWPCSFSPCVGVAAFSEANINAASNFTSFDFPHVADFPSQQVGFHTSTVLGNYIYILGGLRATGANAVTANFWQFDPSTSSIVQLTTQGAPVLWGHTTTAFGARLYIFGGRLGNPSPQASVNNLYTVDAGLTNTFILLNWSGKPTARAFHSTALIQVTAGCYALAVYGGTTPTTYVSTNQNNGGLLQQIQLTPSSSLPEMNIIMLRAVVTSLDGCSETSGGVVQCAPTGNDVLTIIGANLNQPGLNITVDGSLCAVILQTENELLCTVPPGQHSSTPVLLLNSACSVKVDLTGMMAYRSPCSVVGPDARYAALMWTAPNISIVSDTLFVYGGLLPTGGQYPFVISALQDVWLYNTTGQCWSQQRSNTVSVPGGGYTHRAFAKGAHTPAGFVIFGGVSGHDQNNPPAMVNQVDIVTWHPLLLDMSEPTVPLTSASPPKAAYGHSMNYYNGHLYIFGGWQCINDACGSSSTFSVPSIGDISNFTSFDDTTFTAFGNNKQVGFHTSTVVGSYIYIFGGLLPVSFNQRTANLQQFNPATRLMILLPTHGAPTIYGHTAAAFGANLYIFGGRTGSGLENPTRDLYVVDVNATNTFTRMQWNSLPSARALHSMVVMQYTQGCFALAIYGGSAETLGYLSGNQQVNQLLLNVEEQVGSAFGDLTLVILPPVVTSMSGCVGQFPNVIDCDILGNVPLTIQGSNLAAPSATVFIDGVPCPFVIHNDSQIVCTLPPMLSSQTPIVLLTSCTITLNMTGQVKYAELCSKTMSPVPRFGALMWTAPNVTVASDALFLYGGVAPTDSQLIAQDVWLYRILGACWTHLRADSSVVAGGGWPARAFAAAAHTPAGFVVNGGLTTDPNNVVVNQTDVITWFPLSYQLTRPNVLLAVNPPNALAGHTLNYVDGSLFIFGGWPCGSSPCTTVQQFAERNINEATNFTSFDFGASAAANFITGQQVGFHTSTVLGNGDDGVYIFGGVSASVTNAVTERMFRFDPLLLSLTQLTTVGAPKRWGHAAAAFGATLYIFGGRSSLAGEPYQNTLFAVDAGLTNTFTAVSGPSVPTARGFHSMLATQFQPSCYALAIYGGTTSTAFVSTDQNSHTLFTHMESAATGALGDVNLVILQPPSVIYFDGCTSAFPAVIDCLPQGGSLLTIVGTNFGQSGATVVVGGIACPVTQQTETRIICTLPPLTPSPTPDVIVTACLFTVNVTAHLTYAPLLPVPRFGAMMWAVANETISNDVFVYGGITPGVNNVSDEVWHYAINTGKWTVARAPGAGVGSAERAFARLQWTDLGLVIEGGITIDLNTNLFLSRQIDVVSWQPLTFAYAAGGSGANFVPQTPPPRLFGHTLSYVAQRLYIIGGFPCNPNAPWHCQADDATTISEVMPAALEVSLDPTTGMNFNSMNTPPSSGTPSYSAYSFEGYAFHTATVVGSEIWLLGGRTVSSLDQGEVANDGGTPPTVSVQVYNTTNDVWTPHFPVVHFSRWGHTAELFLGQIYVFGGRDSQDNYVNELRSLDTTAVVWTIYSLASAPVARMFHSMALVQFQPSCHALMVYGGTTSVGVFGASQSDPPLLFSLLNAIAADDFLGDINTIVLTGPVANHFSGCTPAYPNVVNCSTAGNVSLAIVGSNLDPPSAAVTVGGTACPITKQNSTTIVCTLPRAPPVGQSSELVLSVCGIVLHFASAVQYTGAVQPQQPIVSSSSSSTHSSTGPAGHSSSTASSTARKLSSSSTGGGATSTGGHLNASSSSTYSATAVDSSSGIDNATTNSSSSSSTAETVTQPAQASKPLLTDPELYATIFGTIAGAFVIAGVLLLLAWQLGWGAFGATAAAAAAVTAASTGAGASAGTAAAADVGVAATATVGARARIDDEERVPLFSTRPPSTRRY